MEVLNSVLNLIANLLLFIAGFMFYYNHITKSLPKFLYHTLRFFTALLVTGAFSRVIFDLNIIISGQNRNFDMLEAVIALSRNFGLGVILIYLVYKKA
jgi:hypothetical protein